jgi:hypothetical protein
MDTSGEHAGDAFDHPVGLGGLRSPRTTTPVTSYQAQTRPCACDISARQQPLSVRSKRTQSGRKALRKALSL